MWLTDIYNSVFRKPQVGQLVWFEGVQYRIAWTNSSKTEFDRTVSEDGSQIIAHICLTPDLEWLGVQRCWGVKGRLGAISNR